jgi:hypothetical protein
MGMKDEEMSQANQAPPAAPTTPGDEKQPLQALAKALLDEERLRLLGLLAQQPATVAALRQQTALPEARLQVLQEVGLVAQRTAAGEAVYSLDVDAMQQWKRWLFASEPSSQPATPQEKVLARFVRGEQLVQLPAQPDKLRLVLEWLAAQFAVGVDYPEREVNRLLQRHLVDQATLRRLLVDYGFLQRQAGIYRRVAASEADEAATT